MITYKKSARNSQLIIWFLLLLHFSASGQLEHLKGAQVFSIHSDNDLFRLDGIESDRYYTAGHSISFGFGTRLKDKFSKFILSTPFKKGFSWIEASLSQQVNTPEILSTSVIQTGDYPYAASLYATLSRTTFSDSEKSRFRTSVLVGTIGRWAFGKEFQQAAHSIVRSSYPIGWHNQLPNQVIFNYDVFFESKMASLFSKSFVTAFGQSRVGNFYTGLQAGFNFNFFTFSKMFFDDFVVAKPSKRWRASFSFSPSVKWVGWNSMLQGSPFESSMKEATYRIDKNQLNNWMASVSVSVGFAKGKHTLQFRQTYLSKEFDSNSENAGNVIESVREQLYGTIRYSLFLKDNRIGN